jgi:hypothetical protein
VDDLDESQQKPLVMLLRVGTRRRQLGVLLCEVLALTPVPPTCTDVVGKWGSK